ncbi:hypothetical protein BJ138DRAFT_1075462 [Hygrophoropsis aurantiaca]|uniref:Uncharacterized protein n=1 Tax=Hygrophoropsis aurantiaca TaxID=72124 RepID=A0ACB8AU30_9AGAM|nr:hypothetical protein BJ138DRAFT_1075462 [Hygrophoropsis aurantiaca]
MSLSANPAMATPNSTDFPSVIHNEENCFQRRLRHISSIQIRNLTPFPVRDAFASALSQPATHSQFTALGNLSDDLDLSFSRKRSRRISSNSINTLRNARPDEITVQDTKGGTEGRGRRRTQSKISIIGTGIMGPEPSSVTTGSLPTNTASPTIRPTNRVRTSSMMSSLSVSGTNTSVAASSITMPFTSSIVGTSSLLLDHTQKNLETVISSRLVPTFITITVPESPVQQRTSQSPSVTRGVRAEGIVRARSATAAETGSLRDKSVKSSSSQQASRGRPSSTTSYGNHIRKESPASDRATAPLKRATTHIKAASVSLSHSPAKSHNLSSSPSSNPGADRSSLLPSASSPPNTSHSRTISVPNYLSPIHRPSTNPSFVIDARSKFEFSEWTDLSSDRIKIELWAKLGRNVGTNANPISNGKGKEKAQPNDPNSQTTADDSWKVLKEWDVRLSELISVTDELESHPSHLPSNTLFVSFAPFGQTFYLPSARTPASRSPSPTGYNSDPETQARNLRTPNPSQNDESSRLVSELDSRSSTRHHRSRKVDVKTGSCQDLLQLVTVQSCILDNKESLATIVREMDSSLIGDNVAILKREASERQARIQDRIDEHTATLEQCGRLRNDIAARQKQIAQRKDYLAQAKEVHAQEIGKLLAEAEVIIDKRNSLSSLHDRLPPIRTALISTLSTIFPIDLLSPSELLFTILSVPLPIPFHPSEPAPPLSLHSHKEVTEESVATALGYAAQVVQLLAIYMGKRLVYPITCVGSRSLIRDNISAMVGPRMFPLFSKGVDTYRFEYGVFLLNKDIEMLMGDRDLRALDMRHTLPNLKNLLLTLTDGESVNIPIVRPFDSPASSAGLATPPRLSSPPPILRLTPDSPKGQSNIDLPVDDNSPPNSGSTTPVASNAEASSGFSKYSKLSIGFPPLPGFFRSRSVTSRSEKPVAAHNDEADESSNTPASLAAGDAIMDVSRRLGEEDEDRRTIRGVTVDCDDNAKVEGKHVANGHCGPQSTGEKSVDGSTAPPATPSAVGHG